MPPARCHVAVVGAGGFGGWIARHLLARGAAVTLLDAWGPGNTRSSSGGETRVNRALYGPDRVYVEMVARSFPQWSALAAEAGEPLYRETGVLWLVRREGHPYVEAALPILADLGFPVEQPSLAEAARRWPQIDLEGIGSVLLERRAGALFARRACRALARRLAAAGGEVRVAHAQPAAIERGRLTGLRLADGSTLAADAYVFACGPWLGRLFPDLVGDALQATRQEVFYFGTPAGDPGYSPERLPVWIDLGERFFYGLPDLEGRGFKLADDTRGEPIDPSTTERRPSRRDLERARRFLARRFPALAGAPLIESRVCQYENSPDGDLILDRHPAADNLWLAGGGSGHGFKLAPAVGEMLAAAILDGSPLPARFALARLGARTERATQFEHRAAGV